MAFTSVNGGALFGTVIPIIRTAIFSSPTVSGQVSIGSITGNFISYTITRNGSNIATAQTASTYTDTSLSNNTQYTYTIVPYMNGAKGIAFTAIVNPNNAGTPGKIYTLASTSTLSLTYNGAGSSTTVVSFTWIGTANNFNSLSIQYPNGTALSTPAYNAATQTYTSGSSYATNTQYTYYVYATNGDGIGSGLAACQSTKALCTWATAPTLTYNGSGSSTSQISFSFSGGTYTNLSVQYPSGTEITKTTTSPYTSGAFSANQQVTYYVFPINALAYISSNSSSVAVCTWGSCNTPSFSGTTSTGVTVAVGGTYTNAVVTYNSGINGSPSSGTSTLYSTLSVGKAYSTFTAGSNVTFVAAPVNALGYQSTNTSTATQQLTVVSSGPTPIVKYVFNSSYVTNGRLKNSINNIYDLNLQTATITTIGGYNCLNCNGSYGKVDTAVANNTLTLITSSTSVAAITISFWAYRTTTQGTAGLWEWSNSGNFNGTEMEFQIDANNVRFWFNNGGQYPLVGSIIASTWGMYAIVILTSGSYITYKNNAQSASGTCTASQLNVTRNDFRIGGQSFDANFTGYIADFRLYNIQLTLAQIQSLYAAGASSS